MEKGKTNLRGGHEVGGGLTGEITLGISRVGKTGGTSEGIAGRRNGPGVVPCWGGGWGGGGTGTEGFNIKDGTVRTQKPGGDSEGEGEKKR